MEHINKVRKMNEIQKLIDKLESEKQDIRIRSSKSDLDPDYTLEYSEALSRRFYEIVSIIAELKKSLTKEEKEEEIDKTKFHLNHSHTRNCKGKLIPPNMNAIKKEFLYLIEFNQDYSFEAQSFNKYQLQTIADAINEALKVMKDE